MHSRLITCFFGLALLGGFVLPFASAAKPKAAASPADRRAELIEAKALLRGLSHANAEHRRAAIEALLELAPVCLAAGAVPTLVELAKSDQDSKVRELSLHLLGEIGSAAGDLVIPMTLELMAHKQPGRVRGWAVFALGKMKPPIKLVAKRLIPLLLWPDDFLQTAVRGALLDLDDKVLPLLMVLIDQVDGVHSQVEILRAIAAFGPRAQPLVPTLLAMRESHINQRMRDAFLGAVLDILPEDSPQAAALMLEKLAEAKGYQRYRLISKLGERGPVVAAALPVLVQALRDPDKDVRSVALGAIAQIVTPQTGEKLIPELIPFLEGDWFMASKAADALVACGPAALPALYRATGHESARVRRFGWQALAKYGPGEAGRLEALIVRFDNETDRPVREAIAAMIGAHKQTAVSTLVSAADRELDPTMRASLISELGGCGPAALEPLRKGLRDADQGVRAAAASALVKLGSAAAPAVIDLLRVESSSSMRNGLQALNGMGEGALAGLVAGLSDSSPKVRERAAYGFGLVGPPAASGVRALCRALSDPIEDVRQWAAWSIGHLGPAADYAVEDLQAALIDPSDDVREFAAQSLGQLGPTAHQAIDDLIPLLSDSQLYVAEKTAKTLGRFGQAAEKAVPALVETLQNHKNDTTRSAAARALGAIGKRTPAVRKALLTALADKGARVRWAAGDALLQVGRPEDVAEARRVIRRAPNEAMRQDAEAMRRFNRSLGL